MPRLGLLTTKHQAVRAGYGVADDATGSEIAWAMISSPRILSARLAVQYWRSISSESWPTIFRSFVSAIMYCISLFYCMCHTRCPCDTNVTRRVAGRVTHYYHTWLTLHKTKNRTVKGLHLLQCVIYGKI